MRPHQDFPLFPVIRHLEMKQLVDNHMIAELLRDF